MVGPFIYTSSDRTIFSPGVGYPFPNPENSIDFLGAWVQFDGCSAVVTYYDRLTTSYSHSYFHIYVFFDLSHVICINNLFASPGPIAKHRRHFGGPYRFLSYFLTSRS